MSLNSLIWRVASMAEAPRASSTATILSGPSESDSNSVQALSTCITNIAGRHNLTVHLHPFVVCDERVDGVLYVLSHELGKVPDRIQMNRSLFHHAGTTPMHMSRLTIDVILHET